MLDERLFRGISVYQDVVLDGRTVRRGSRDCEARWELMAPVLSECRTLLDVGSNFGWFGLKFCELKSDGVVASVEADLRSAAVQRRVLESHAHRRLCLLTRRAGARLVRTLERQDQRFDAVLCLSVLHWVPEHREFLEGLGRLGDRLIIEHPDPGEENAGVERLRSEMGPLGPYLRRCFPNRPMRKLGQTESHLHADFQREIWLVEPSPARSEKASAGLSVPALLDLGVSWPPRSWWLGELARRHCDDARRASLWEKLCRARDSHPFPQDEDQLRFTHQGIEPARNSCRGRTLSSLRSRIRRIPEQGTLAAGTLLYRRSRSVLGTTVRGLARIRRSG